MILRVLMDYTSPRWQFKFSNKFFIIVGLSKTPAYGNDDSISSRVLSLIRSVRTVMRRKDYRIDLIHTRHVLTSFSYSVSYSIQHFYYSLWAGVGLIDGGSLMIVIQYNFMFSQITTKGPGKLCLSRSIHWYKMDCTRWNLCQHVLDTN